MVVGSCMSLCPTNVSVDICHKKWICACLCEWVCSRQKFSFHIYIQYSLLFANTVSVCVFQLLFFPLLLLLLCLCWTVDNRIYQIITTHTRTHSPIRHVRTHTRKIILNMNSRYHHLSMYVRYVCTYSNERPHTHALSLTITHIQCKLNNLFFLRFYLHIYGRWM